MEKVAERSTGQIPRASLHEYLLYYDRNDKFNVNIEFTDLSGPEIQ
jgi:hypothetical protein